MLSGVFDGGSLLEMLSTATEQMSSFASTPRTPFRQSPSSMMTGLGVLDGEQKAAHDLVHLVAGCSGAVGSTGVGRGRCGELRLPAARACRLENLISAGAVGWRARHLVPAQVDDGGVVLV